MSSISRLQRASTVRKLPRGYFDDAPTFSAGIKGPAEWGSMHTSAGGPSSPAGHADHASQLRAARIISGRL